MNRREAIDHIWSLARGVAGEFASSDAERDEIYQKAATALMALGVSSGELANWKDDPNYGLFDDYPL